MSHPELCSDERREPNKAVELVFSELRDVFWFIQDNVESDLQQDYAVKLFASLGKFSDISKLAEAILEAKKNLKIEEIKAEVDDEKQEKTDAEKRAGYLDDMFEIIESQNKSGVGAKAEATDGGEAFVTM